MFKNFAETETLSTARTVERPTPAILAATLPSRRAPADGEVTRLKAEIARREASLAKEHACEHINGLRVKRLNRELALLRRRWLMIVGERNPGSYAA